MRDFVNLWVSRFETLLSCDVLIKADLTGGLDSRAVFSMLQNAKQRLGYSNASIKIHCGASPIDLVDRDVATAVCKNQNLTLNE